MCEPVTTCSGSGTQDFRTDKLVRGRNSARTSSVPVCKELILVHLQREALGPKFHYRVRRRISCNAYKPTLPPDAWPVAGQIPSVGRSCSFFGFITCGNAFGDDPKQHSENLLMSVESTSPPCGMMKQFALIASDVVPAFGEVSVAPLHPKLFPLPVVWPCLPYVPTAALRSSRLSDYRVILPLHLSMLTSVPGGLAIVRFKAHSKPDGGLQSIVTGREFKRLVSRMLAKACQFARAGKARTPWLLLCTRVWACTTMLWCSAYCYDPICCTVFITERHEVAHVW